MDQAASKVILLEAVEATTHASPQPVSLERKIEPQMNADNQEVTRFEALPYG